MTPEEMLAALPPDRQTLLLAGLEPGQLPPDWQIEEAYNLYIASLGDESSRWIGVPDDYVATIRTPQQGFYYDSTGTPRNYGDVVTTVEPRYSPGDEALFGLEGGFSPLAIPDLQARLLEAGLLDIENIVAPGFWGPKEQSAMKTVMHMANASGQTYDQVLDTLIESGEFRAQFRPGRRGPGRAPFKPRTPNRNEVKRAYRDIRKRMLGGQFTRTDDQAFEAEQEAFADAFEAQVVGAQRAAYEGRAVEEPPSLEAAAMDTLEEDQAAGVKAFSFAGLASAMTRALGGT